jgi:hypothetical protein
LIDNHLILCRLRRHRNAVFIGRGHVIGRDDRVILAGFVNLHRLAVKIRVREMVGRTPEINQCEIKLLGVLVNAGSAPDDLLEFRHGTYGAVKHDETAGLCIHSGR